MNGIMLHKDRIAYITLNEGKLSTSNGNLKFIGKDRELDLPVEQFSAINLEHGTTVTHSAIELAAKHGTMINWVGDGGVRLYSSGLAINSRTDRLWKQMEMALNKNKRLSVAKNMYRHRFGTKASLSNTTIETLCLMEGRNVKELYKSLANEHGVEWNGRWFDNRDRINLALSVANSCIYGVAHVAILACGYNPAIGFIHGKTAQSFVYDVADLVKFQTVTRIAFSAVGENCINLDGEVRHRCRDLFREQNMISTLISLMDKAIGFIPNDSLEPERQLPVFDRWNYDCCIEQS